MERSENIRWLNGTADDKLTRPKMLFNLGK